MSAREADTPATVEDVIALIRALPRGERQRLLSDEELLTNLADSLKRSKATPLIAARLLPDALKVALAGWSWNRSSRQQLGLSVPVRVYMQDPGEDEDARLAPKPIEIDWEPCLADGPTSSRVAVIDRDATTGRHEPPAAWDPHLWTWVMPRQSGETGSPRRVPADRHCPQFRQINAWAVVESALAYYEDPAALGRAIPWGFEGNRLIVVPHAGQLANAYYDRRSKSLQFHYCGPADNPIYTCLSHDIIAHEAGHAILDGVRPRYPVHLARTVHPARRAALRLHARPDRGAPLRGHSGVRRERQLSLLGAQTGDAGRQ